MSQQIRLKRDLVSLAASEAHINKRSLPKQIEFWADLGRMISKVLTANEIIAVVQGVKKLKVEDREVEYVPLEEIQEDIDQRYPLLSESRMVYEACNENPDWVIQVDRHFNTREPGIFRDGKFKPVIKHHSE